MPKPEPGEGSAVDSRGLSLEWWTGGRGWSGIAQAPNPAIVVWLVALIAKWTGVLGKARSELLVGVGMGALLVWSLDELFRGVSPIRRVMGAIVLGLLAVRLLV